MALFSALGQRMDLTDLNKNVATAHAELLETASRHLPPQTTITCDIKSIVAAQQEFIWYARNLQALYECYGRDMSEEDKLRRVK